MDHYVSGNEDSEKDNGLLIVNLRILSRCDIFIHSFIFIKGLFKKP